MMKSAESPPNQQLNQQATVGKGNKKRWYLLISNPSKTTHLGTLLRCAAAFQVHQVLLVGYDKFNCQGSFGSHLFLDIVVFPSWDSVQDYLRNGGDVDNGINNANDKNSKRSADSAFGDGPGSSINEAPPGEQNKQPRLPQNPVTIIGLLGAYGGGEGIFSPDGMEVYEEKDSFASLIPHKEGANTENNTASSLPQRSHPIYTRQFSSDVCFLLSKDKRGLPLSQAQLCSSFVHVPHLAFDNDDSPTSQLSLQTSLETAKLKGSPREPSIISPISQSCLIDTATSLSIVLHHFTAWAGYAERNFEENQKFVKDIKPNNRRRLCRVIGQNYDIEEVVIENDGESEHDREREAIESMMMWNNTGDASRGSDY